MDPSIKIKKDLQISFGAGIAAGFLAIPILRNLDIPVSLLTGFLIMAGFVATTLSGYGVAYWLSRRFPVMMQVVKFGMIGGVNTLLDLSILNFLIYISGIATGIHFSVFKGISFIIAVTNSYFWNKFWTFRSTEGVQTVEFFKFFIINVVGFVINVSAASFIVNGIGAPPGISLELWANIGAISSVFISLIWNFLGMKFIVFRR